MKKVSVLLWLYHTDLSDEFIDLLWPIQNQTKLHLGLCKTNNNKNVIKKFSIFNDITIDYYDNSGADVLPFLNQLYQLDSDSNPFFIKLHSKKSLWGYNYRCNWRAILLDSLIGSPYIFNANIEQILEYNYSSLGCSSFLYQKHESVHKHKIRELCQLCNINIAENYTFVGGNMFIGDTKIYQENLSPYLSELQSLLYKETGKINENRHGTYSHSMERIFGLLAHNNGGLGKCVLPTVQIKTPHSDISNNIMNMRIMYNNDIYYVDQPSIYGKVLDKQNDFFEVLWNHDDHFTWARYVAIDTNLYVNQQYL